ncbi:hypothetical protein ACFQ0D_36445, partial [Micromonospora zhanjiangensis]
MTVSTTRAGSGPVDAPVAPPKVVRQRRMRPGLLGLAVLLDGPPDGFGAPPDPGEIAARLLASITLEEPPVGIAPHARDGAAGLVGLPVWLWTSGDRGHWGPISRSASDRGLTVTITAAVVKAVWDMGNGDTVECDN